jgi:hypothetical protein
MYSRPVEQSLLYSNKLSKQAVREIMTLFTAVLQYFSTDLWNTWLFCKRLYAFNFYSLVWRAFKKFKETVSRYFWPSFFSLNGTPGGPDSWAKAVLNIDSNSRRNSIRFDYENFKKVFFCDSALCHLVWNSSQKFSCADSALCGTAEIRLCSDAA